MKGAGANVLRGLSGAGALAGFDFLKEIYVSYRFQEKWYFLYTFLY